MLLDIIAGVFAVISPMLFCAPSPHKRSKPTRND